MKTIYVLDPELHDYRTGPLSGGSTFLERFTDYQQGETTTFYFLEEQKLNEAIALLEKHGLAWERFYVFELEPNELKDYPAVYLGIEDIVGLIVDGVINATLLDGREIVIDYMSEQIIVSKRLVEIIQNVARNVDWMPIDASDGRDWSILTVSEVLPEPLFVPLAVEVEEYEAPKGFFSVRSDGRDVITKANINKLVGVGIAVSTEFKSKSKVWKCKPSIIANGGVFYALQDAGAKGLFEPVWPLLIESHLLAHEDTEKATKETRG